MKARPCYRLSGHATFWTRIIAVGGLRVRGTRGMLRPWARSSSWPIAPTAWLRGYVTATHCTLVGGET